MAKNLQIHDASTSKNVRTSIPDPDLLDLDNITQEIVDRIYYSSITPYLLVMLPKGRATRKLHQSIEGDGLDHTKPKRGARSKRKKAPFIRPAGSDVEMRIPDEASTSPSITSGSAFPAADASSRAPSTATSARANHDPVVKEYDVYINDDLAKQLFALQYPSRAKKMPYSKSKSPLELRVKPNAGVVEVDIPMNPDNTPYNKSEGQKWGAAAKSMADEGRGQAYGLAGGYSASIPSRGRKEAAAPATDTATASGQRTNGIEDPHEILTSADEAEDHMPLDSEPAARPTLDRITLAGTLESSDALSPHHMAGVFRPASTPGGNGELYLTPLQGIVQLQPQLNHVDAVDTVTNTAAKAIGKAGDVTGVGRASAVHMTAKILSNEGYDMQEVQKWLRKAQAEPWRKSKVFDQESRESNVARGRLGMSVDDERKKKELKSGMGGKRWGEGICPEEKEEEEAIGLRKV